MGNSGLRHVALYIVPFTAGTHSCTHHLRMVRRTFHKIHEAKKHQRDPARCKNRPVRRKEDQRTLDGRYHHHRVDTRAYPAPGATWKHLSHTDYCYDSVARTGRVPGRLHQDFQKEQGRSRRQMETVGTDDARTICGHYAVSQSAGHHQGEHRDGKVGRQSGNSA